ncbi:TonB-dependent receptor domain-containing protein [Sphingobium sp. CAP-1]|uniref:TonB-dependent receptor domain-containing protein n=1 Tax=Sphingobium sp. CAP-1 TaxID=2676077 RepID=UPI0012BB2E11|nr:TonB-dependent receptor [Sphingobium sp. CAP-1]QGP79429.1 TonB-dependent receptor [Sphingobium sp. CAP-1]
MDDFYAARSRTIPPLPWSNIAPPFSGQMQQHERFGYTLQGGVGGPIIPDVLAIRLAGFYQQDDLNGTRSATTGAESERRIKSGRATLLFTPGDRFELLATYQQTQTKEELIARVAGAGRGYNGPPLTGEENSGVAESPSFVDKTFQFASINAKYDFDFATLNYIGGWTKTVNETKGRFGADPGNAVLGFDYVPGVDANIEVQEWSHELRLQSNTGPGDFLDWTVGYYRSNGGSRVDQNNTFISAGPGGGILGNPAIVGPAGPAVPTASNLNLNYLTQGILRLEPGSFNIFGDPGRDLTQSIFASTTFNFDTGTHVRVGGRYLWGYKEFNFNLAFDGPLRRAVNFGFPTAGVCAFVPAPPGVPPGTVFAASSYPTSCDLVIPIPNPPSLNRTVRINDWVYDINVRQELGDNFNVYASYARSFRAPGASQGNVPPDFVIAPKEKSDNYEIGLKGQLFNRRARFTLAAFQQDFKGYNATVSNIPFLSGGLSVVDAFSLTYGGNARVRGFEADITGDITDRLNARASVSYVKGEFNNALQPCRDSNFDGVPDAGTPTVAGFNNAGVVVATCPTSGRINGLPEWTATVQAEYSIPIADRGEGYLRGLLNYKSSGLIVSSSTAIPEYATLDVYAGIKYDNFRASIFAKNLFDTVRRVDQGGALTTLGSIPTGYREVFYTPGLQIGLNLGFSFGGG